MATSKNAKSGAKLLLIDGHSMAFRAFYALPVENFTTNQGQPTNVLYGFSSMLTGLLTSEKPTHVAVAFDLSRKTFRSEMFPEYKAQRAKTPDEFKAQMDLLFNLVEGFGIKHFSMEGFEADDIIATLASECQGNAQVLICTGDRDSFQLVNENVTVLYPKKGVTELARMTPKAIEEKYGLTPTQYPDFAALRGDPSDNLPSLPGVGEKTATKWIVEYGSLDKLLSSANEITGKVGDSLRAGIESVKLNRILTQLRHDLPLEIGLSDLAWEGINKKHLQDLYQKLEIRSLATRVANLPANQNEPDLSSNPNEWEDFLQETPLVNVSDKVQIKLERPSWQKEIKVEKISKQQLLNKLNTEEFIAVETLSELDEIGVPQISSVGISFDGENAYQIPIELFGEVLSSKIKKILFFSKPIVKWAITNNIEIQNLYLDLQLSAYLLNPGTRHLDYADLTGKYLGLEAEIPQLDLFTAFDPTLAAFTYRVGKILEWELKDRAQFELLENLELPVSQVIAAMELRGITVDQKVLEELSLTFNEEVEIAVKGAYKAAGHEFNVNSPKQLQVVLFDELKLPKTKKIKTGYTTDADSLQWLLEETNHPVLQHLMRVREISKLATTVTGLIEEVKTDSRIHTTLEQTVAATGRLSSIAPNLQNIPVRTGEGRLIRTAFTVKKPYSQLLTADYSQIEMRIMAHLSADKRLIAAFESGEDLHNAVAGLVFGVKPNEVSSDMRRQIKAMSYGLAYGLSTFGLSAQLGLSVPEASDLMKRYMERFGGIRDYLQEVVKQAKAHEYTETILGRRRYLPDLYSDNRQRREAAERMALNAPIQGSAADIIKLAMVKIENLIKQEKLQSQLILQVHDELIFEVVAGEVDKLQPLVIDAMSNAVKLTVPLGVNIGLGKNWDLAAH